MSQSTTVIAGGSGGHTVATMYPVINDNFAAQHSWQSGATAPTTPPTYLRWLDTSASPVLALKINTGTPGTPVWTVLFPDIAVAGGGVLRLSGGTMTGAIAMGSQKITGLANGTAAGDVVNKGQADGKVLVASVKVTGFNATLNRPLFIATSNLTIVNVEALSDTATSGSDGSNKFDFQLRNVDTDGTGTTDMLSAVKSTNGAEIAAYDSYALAPDQNLAMTVNEGLQLRVTKTGSPTDLSAAEMVFVITYTVAV